MWFYVSYVVSDDDDDDATVIFEKRNNWLDFLCDTRGG